MTNIPMDTGATRPAHPGETETWNRNDSASGCSVLLYTLRQDGWRKGQPVMVNDVTVRVEAANGSTTQIGPIADQVLAALSPAASGQTETRKALEAAILDLICDDVLPAYGISSETGRDDAELPSTIRAALASDVQGWRTPEGYVLVPIEPKPEMLGAWYRVKNGHHFHDEPPPTDRSDYAAYRAMLAAAPPAPETRT